ncbi:NAD(P)H-dependent oxidoreductase [Tenacibaculum sp. Bg11-29]|uniref:NAD(P)H-dependent oxidoreductase n=1 Tax=Tenacibaculum sp. Bg11-29 TaxID=2058306 RepID=UPI000C31EFE9|nr:NAD(P)H-dependent oxidoreductase [Tenacibaculum sp. Bg11-29]PKH50893.1 NAD(P)H-dependent oxidoreductase [Tenacibaculum sp. Bg11-29]
MDLINNLEWEYVTKKFDSSKKVSEKKIEQLKKVIQLSTSSYGLQLYKVLIIEEKILREKLKSASYNQNQITEASHLILFCNYATVNESHIDEYFDLKYKTAQLNIANYKEYSDFIKKDISTKSQIEKDKWTSNQTYIALENLLNACAALKIDTCPMEGFNAEKYNEILNLTKQNLSTTVIATVGYRSDKDSSQHSKKIRKPIENIFI